jgi:DNA-binding transcriptional regulator YdaS (Cro superfamily)
MLLRDYLMQNNITISKFAAILGYHHVHLGQMILGRYPIPRRTVNAIFTETRGAVTPTDWANISTGKRQRNKRKPLISNAQSSNVDVNVENMICNLEQ